MKYFSLFICLLTLTLSQLAIAGEDVKANPVAVPKAVEKKDAGVVQLKIGSVDLPKVAEKSDAGTRAMATLKEMYEKFQASMKKKEKELEKLKTALQGKDLTPEKRAAKEKQFQKKFGEYQKSGSDAQKEFAEKQAELGKKIKEDLDRLVKDYGREHGYAVIINKEGLVYNDSKYDITDLTDDILKLANSAGKK